MFSRLKTCAAMLVVIIGLVAVVPVASASGQYGRHPSQPKEDKAAMMIADALVVRPLGLVATVVGGAFFLVSLPFSALGGNSGEAYDRLVVDPARYTFTRELGDFRPPLPAEPR